MLPYDIRKLVMQTYRIACMHPYNSTAGINYRAAIKRAIAYVEGVLADDPSVTGIAAS